MTEIFIKEKKWGKIIKNELVGFPAALFSLVRLVKIFTIPLI